MLHVELTKKDRAVLFSFCTVRAFYHLSDFKSLHNLWTLSFLLFMSLHIYHLLLTISESFSFCANHFVVDLASGKIFLCFVYVP